MKNPFPGLNPYLEMHWSDVHVTLLGSIKEQLAERLPADLVVRVEEHLIVDADDGTRNYRADVAVEESWKAGVAPGWSPNESRGDTVIAEPTVVELNPEIHRWLEIRDRGGRIVTVIEVLSPANKREGQGRESYLAKQRDYLASSANLVEIDLLRGGRWSCLGPISRRRRWAIPWCASAVRPAADARRFIPFRCGRRCRRSECRYGRRSKMSCWNCNRSLTAVTRRVATGCWITGVTRNRPSRWKTCRGWTNACVPPGCVRCHDSVALGSRRGGGAFSFR